MCTASTLLKQILLISATSQPELISHANCRLGGCEALSRTVAFRGFLAAPMGAHL